MDKEVPGRITEDGILHTPTADLPTDLTLVSFRRDLLLMPSIMLSRFPKLDRSRPVRLTGVAGTILQLTDDEINLLGTRHVVIVANGGVVYIFPNSDRLGEAKREAHAVVERALNPAGASKGKRSISKRNLVVISYANKDRAYADLLAKHMYACSINAWHYVPSLPAGAMLVSPLEDALRDASALAVLMSPYSSTSSAVEQEVQIAIARRLLVLPILLGGHPLPMLARFAYFDATSGELPSKEMLRAWLRRRSA